ncbi:MAG TPA: lysylphosphatidylglycerol synthase transmembrane domain-containing protein [Bacteroidota bacterium]|jgi:hypothetical protein|nr:lysylphosphatidylglycerol synthase transmembrane domain-containing protein [Bacteroidota bacterium]
MKRILSNSFKYVFSIALTLGFLYFAFKGTDFQALWTILSHANYWWALAMIPPLLLSHICRAWRWEYLLRPVKKDLKFRNLFSAMSVGYLVNNILPKVGEIVRPYAIGRLERISRSSALGTLLVERIFDMVSFLLMIAMIPLVYSGPLTQVFPWLEETGIWISVVTVAGIAILTFLMLRRDVVVWLLNFVTRHFSPRRAKFIERVVHSFLDGFLFLKEPKNYFIIAILSILVWGLYIIMMLVPFYAFGLEQKYALDIRSAVVLQGISSIGYMAPTPGATGPYHYFTVQALTKLYGVDDELARSYAVVTHALGYLTTSILGMYFVLHDKLHLVDLMKEESSSAQVNGEATGDS